MSIRTRRFPTIRRDCRSGGSWTVVTMVEIAQAVQLAGEILHQSGCLVRGPEHLLHVDPSDHGRSAAEAVSIASDRLRFLRIRRRSLVHQTPSDGHVDSTHACFLSRAFVTTLAALYEAHRRVDGPTFVRPENFAWIRVGHLEPPASSDLGPCRQRFSDAARRSGGDHAFVLLVGGVEDSLRPTEHQVDQTDEKQ